MKQIKFRGYWLHGGSYIYGCGVKADSDATYIVADNLFEMEVEPDSVAQLVGYDKNDKEIYSDDTVFCSDGNERLVADILINFNSIGGHFDNVILKEN